MRILILDNFRGLLDLELAARLEVDKIILRNAAVMDLYHVLTVKLDCHISAKDQAVIKQRWLDTDRIYCYTTRHPSDESPVPLLKPVLGFRFVHVTKAEVEAEQANQPVFGGGF